MNEAVELHAGLCHGGPRHGELVEVRGSLFHIPIRVPAEMKPLSQGLSASVRIGEYRWAGDYWRYAGEK